MPFYNRSRVDLVVSPDGVCWDSVIYTWHNQRPTSERISEATFTSFEDSIVIGFFRTDYYYGGGPLRYVISFNKGKTFSKPVKTNIAEGYYCVAPFLVNDSVNEKVWLLTNDRRGENPFIGKHDDESIWIYSNSYGAIRRSEDWCLEYVISRPYPGIKRLFGYPTGIILSNDSMLIGFTESYYRKPSGEGTAFFEFLIPR
jgi:hypothetical protein